MLVVFHAPPLVALIANSLNSNFLCESGGKLESHTSEHGRQVKSMSFATTLGENASGVLFGEYDVRIGAVTTLRCDVMRGPVRRTASTAIDGANCCPTPWATKNQEEVIEDLAGLAFILVTKAAPSLFYGVPRPS